MKTIVNIICTKAQPTRGAMVYTPIAHTESQTQTRLERQTPAEKMQQAKTLSHKKVETQTPSHENFPFSSSTLVTPAKERRVRAKGSKMKPMENPGSNWPITMVREDIRLRGMRQI